MGSDDLPAIDSGTDIDYSRYRFTSVIDWVQVRVKLSRATNFFTMRRHFNLHYVKGIGEQTSRAATEFEFRVHDIQKWHELHNCLDAIESKFGFTHPPEITGVEVTFDAFSKSNDRAELVKMAGHFYKYVTRPFSKNRRFARDYKGSAFQSRSIRHIDNLNKFNIGWTAYIGCQSADGRTQRIYVKTTDREMPLNYISEHRARYEVTLVNQECPFKTVDEAKTFKFQSLAPYFAFRRLKPNIFGIMEIIMKRRADVGLVNPIRRKNGGMRNNNRHTLADSQLNEIAYDCLRNLTLRLT